MERFLLGEDLTVIILLVAFIIGLLTKRFVPWWVHETVVEKLEHYEEAAPDLINEVKRLMTLLEEEEEVVKDIQVLPPRRVNPRVRRKGGKRK